MDNLTIFANKAEYEKNRINLEYPNVSFIEEDLNTITRKRYHSGNLDKEGLKAIGWSDDDINNFDYKGVNWDEAQDAQYIVPQTDKNLVPMNKSKIAGAKTTMKYCPYFDTSQNSSMDKMFSECYSLIAVPKFDTRYAREMYETFYYCENLTTVPLFNTSQVETMENCFSGCHSLTSVPKFDTSNVTNMGWMFKFCQSLDSVPHFDTSKVTNMNDMFAHCRSLTTVPKFDTSNVTNMFEMFEGCTSLTSVPLFNTSKVFNMERMFNGCTNLISVPQFDTSKVIYMSEIFSYCTNLTDLGGFTGLKVSIDLSYSPNLARQSLLNVINEAASGVSGVTMTFGSTNLNKLTVEEKAIATNKGWTLA